MAPSIASSVFVMYFPSTIDMTMYNLHSLSLSLARHLVAAVYFLLVSCFILHWKYGVRYQVTAVITFLAEMKRMESERKERKNDDHAWLNFLFNSRCHLIFFFQSIKENCNSQDLFPILFHIQNTCLLHEIYSMIIYKSTTAFVCFSFYCNYKRKQQRELLLSAHTAHPKFNGTHTSANMFFFFCFSLLYKLCWPEIESLYGIKTCQRENQIIWIWRSF